ncbi:MAG: HigA family addiction module antitoxin [Rhodospirillaceae bacterium]|nr:HigA family addiction module antitoxin [Rhodospirillaceae bacterium]
MPRTPIHPGEHLTDALIDLGLSARQLARAIKVPANRITGIMKGRRAVTADTALRLGHYFGMSAQFWLNLQQIHDLRVAEKRAGRAIKSLERLSRRAA